MKPFDLEAAKRGEPLITRDGREAHFIAHTDKVASADKVMAVVSGDWRAFTEQGERCSGAVSTLDLFMAPKKRTVWVNLYRNYAAIGYDTEERADDGVQGDRIGDRAWPLEIEE